MARCARIRNTKLLCKPWRDEAERVATDEIIAKSLGNLWHVAGSALTACAALAMVGVLAHCATQSSWIVLCVAAQAKLVTLCDQIGWVLVTMNLMAVEGRNPRWYMTLWTKSFPCIRFLCAEPSCQK